MSDYSLPTSVEVNGKTFAIRSDYRAILDILEAMNDPELTDEERGEVVYDIFYPEPEGMGPDDYQEAYERLVWFINGGEGEGPQNRPKLVDWTQDFPYIVSPVNRVLGSEVRSVEYLHWWTFLAAYQEIGDCYFAQVVGIRAKRAKGQKLDKTDQEFYRKNRHVIDFKRKYTDADNDAFDMWLGKKKTAP